MKTIFISAVATLFLFSCKTIKMATPAPNTMSKPAADTALQGDKMKDPTKL